MDIENYEAFKDKDYLEGLTQYNRQQELLYRLKKEETAVAMDLQKEKNLIAESLGHINEQEGSAPLNDRDQVLKDLSEVERKVKERHAQAEKGDRVLSDPIRELMAKVDKEQQDLAYLKQIEQKFGSGLTTQNSLDKYRIFNKLESNQGQTKFAEDMALERMAMSFEPFNFSEIVQA